MKKGSSNIETVDYYSAIGEEDDVPTAENLLRENLLKKSKSQTLKTSESLDRVIQQEQERSKTPDASTQDGGYRIAFKSIRQTKETASKRFSTDDKIQLESLLNSEGQGNDQVDNTERSEKVKKRSILKFKIKLA